MASKPKAVVSVIAIAVAGVLIAKLAFGPRSGTVTVAVIDTGLDLAKAPELKELLALNARENPGDGKDDDENGFVDDSVGWNFFDNTPDTGDLSGHGTAVSQIVAKGCERRCRILPVRVAHHGGGIRPDDLAQAVLYAVQRGARVINVSFGISGGSDALKTALSRAARAGVIVVTAAGEGVPNPFRPSRLEKLFPQSNGAVVVVGSAESPDSPDTMMNYGPELDLVVVQRRGSDRFGSSFAAAEVSGAVALHPLLADEPKENLVARVRHLLRATSDAPTRFDPDHMGFGAFDQVHFLKTEDEPLAHRLYLIPDSSGKRSVEVAFSSSETIASLGGAWECPSKPGEPDIHLTANSGPKGQARLRLAPAAAEDCRVKARVTLPGGRTQDVTLPIR